MTDTNNMVKIGGLCGIMAMLLLAAVIIATNLLPGFNTESTEGFLSAMGKVRGSPIMMIMFLLTAAFGPLGIVAFLGLHRSLTAERSSVMSQIATIFGCTAFVLVDAMLIVQGTVNMRMGKMYLSASPAEQPIILSLYRGLRSIDLGLDLAWDVFIAIAVFLYGIVMIRNRHFGRLLGISGILIAAALLLLNAATVPTPPGSAGLVDLGPLLFLWILLVSVQLVRSAKTSGRE